MKRHYNRQRSRVTFSGNRVRRRFFRPNVEQLESRLVLAVLVESGDFVGEIERLKDLAFTSGSNLYVPPNVQEQADFHALADALLAEDVAAADTQATAMGYEVVEFTDNVSGDVYHGLREQLSGGQPTKGWGSFFVNLDFVSDALVEVPHPLFDTNSWDLGAKAFRDADARGFLLAGAHRNANGTGTADVAHLAASIFQEVHESWVGANGETDAWQVHGFDDANHAFPTGTDAVLSNGDGSVSSEVVALDAELEAHGFLTHAYNTLAVNDPLNVTVNGSENGTTFSSLGGTTNEQGIHSRSLGGIFVHAELEQSIRFDAGNRDLAAGDISNAILAESSFQIDESTVRSLASNSATVVPFGATWKYLDDGSDQGTAWTAAGFNDTAWSSGPAELGYGDGDEATVTASGFATTYFRHSFNANASAVSQLDLSVIRDDAVAVYLNGVEILRDGLVANAAYNDFATQTIANAGESTPVNASVLISSLPAGTLVTGTNVLAVEIHQVSLSSSDISFDLQLNTVGTDTQVTVDFNADVDVATLQASDLLVDGAAIAMGVTLDDADTATFTIPTQAAGTHTLGIDAATIAATDGTALGEWSRTFDVAADTQYTINHSPRLQPGDQPLVGYAGSATDRVELLWQTVSAGSGSQDSFAVEYRLDGTTDPWLAAPATSQIPIPTGGRINHYTTITGLSYDTDYEYRVRHLQADVIVDEYASSFKTRLAAGDQTAFRFAAYGDSADLADIQPFRDVQNRINIVDPAFAVLLGDNVYDSGTHNESDARFDPGINPEAATWTAGHIDYVGFGNHDIVSDGGQPGEDNFSVPIPVAGVTAPASVPAAEPPEHNYSFDYGNVHFVTFDTNSLNDATRLDNQLTWMEADLAATTAQWKIVFGHHPVTGSPDKGESAADNYYQEVVPRLLAAGVDVLLMGHSHTYHRTMPLLGHNNGVETFVNDTDNAYDQGAGLVQLVAGTGGKSLRPGDFSVYPFNAAGFSTTTNPIVEYGFSQFDVTPTQLTVSYIAADDGATLDQFTINAGVDTTPPVAALSAPQDNGPSDLDPAVDAVSVTGTQPTFDIQLSDGSGVDDATVTSATVSITKDAAPLVEATDYTFGYNAATDTITLTSLGGDFSDGNFVVTLSGGAATIDDSAGNSMPSTPLTIDIDTSLQVVSFQQGVGGYTSSVDTFVQEASPSANNATATSLNVDNDDPASSGQDVQSLLRFDNIFGAAAGQIPTNATIQSATLTLNVSNLGDPLALHRMLGTWTDADNWNSLVGGVSADGVEGAATADVTTASVPTGAVAIDVLASLQAWNADPGTNFGWAILPTGTNGVDFDSSEGGTPPTLEVQFTTTSQPPASLYESFESGLSADWSITSVDPEARVQIRDLASEGIITAATSLEYTQNGNANSLAFDSTNQSGDGVADLGLAIWTVDLSAFSTDAMFTYHQFEGDGNGSGDENDSLPVGVHATTAAGDGISISIDGVNWYELFDMGGSDLNRSGDGLWQLHEIDLASEIARINTAFGAGLSFTSSVQLKWSQYDAHSLPSDGWAIDEIRIQTAASTFTTNRPRGAFHTFTVPSEDDGDYFYRAALFGNVAANTPILVSTHGDTSAFSYESYARRWHRYVADPANGVNSLIVVTPVFVPDSYSGSPTRYDDHHTFGWNPNDNAAADLVLLETVDAIQASGFGDASGLYLWGYSAGGQFTNRFTAAHPDRVAAAVVGGAGVQMLPTESVAFPRGFGAKLDYPLPAGVTLNIDEYLKSRVQLWVGENDNDPNHSQLDQSNETTSVQGADRVERAVNQFEAVVAESADRGISPTEFEHELFIAADDAHSWGEDDLPQIYDFLFRTRNATDLPIEVHPRVVLTASADDQTASLPQNVAQLDAGQTFFVELWVAAPSGGADGVRSGQLDIYFDPAAATINAAAIDHGSVFSTATGHAYDVVNDPGFVRSFTGTTTAASVGVNEYALLGRFELTASGGSIDPTQLVLGLQRSGNLDFELETFATHRTDFQPFLRTTVDADDQGAQGVVFDDTDGDGSQDADETGIAGRTVELQTTGGATFTLTRGVEPDDVGSGSYLNEASPWATLSAIGADILSPGVRSFTSTGNASTGDRVFSYFFDDGVTTSGVGSLWRSGDRELRIDFNTPASSVSIDAIGTSAGDVARLDVYDASDTLLGTYTTAILQSGTVETMTVASPSIAYAIATGDGQTVRLDNLQFDVQPVVTTNASGEYNLPDLDVGSFNVVAELPAGWIATSPPASTHAVAIAAGGLLAGRDFGQQQPPPLPTVTMAATDASAAEAGPDPGTFTVTRTGDTAAALNVSYTIAGSATNGSDFTTLSGSVTIPIGQLSVPIIVTPIDDLDVEPAETVVLTLAADAAYLIGGASSDAVTIADNDAPPNVDDRALSEANSSGSIASGDYTSTHASDDVYEGLTEELYAGNKRSRLQHEWTFNVTGGSTVTFYVEAWHDSTAEDFIFEYSTDGSTWTTMLTITNNADVDAPQTFDLPAATSGTVLIRVADTDRSRGESSADTIFVDDIFIRSVNGGGGLPTVTILATDAVASEPGSDTGTFTVSRTGDMAASLVVSYAVGGTASPGSDYSSLSGVVTIPSGQPSATIDVLPLDDGLVESAETVVITLSADAAYAVGTPSGDTVTIADDEVNPGATDRAVSDNSINGSITAGDYTRTHASDNSYESLTEELYAGNKRSRLEHHWTFDVTGGSSVTFSVEAHHDSSAEDFQFAYSTDLTNWIAMLTVSKNADDDTPQSFAMPALTSGTVYVRVIDTDRNRNENSADTIFIDDMFIESQSGAALAMLEGEPEPPDSRLALQSGASEPSGSTLASQATGRTIGYFPYYRGASKNSIDYSALTHINYFNLDATAVGDLVTTNVNYTDLGDIVTQADANGVGVSIAVGGWLSDSYFVPMSRDPAARANFISQVAQFALDNNLDGVDLDWEPIDVAAGDDFYYSTLIEELDAALDPLGLILTVAVNPQRHDIQPFAVDNLDWVNVMGYDMNWQNAEHALYADAVAALDFWDDIVPKHKLNLGIPFYGRDDNWNAIMYSTIVDTYNPTPDQNYAGPYWFNGQDLVEDKTRYVYDNAYGGTMIWEVGQDKFDNTSLLGVIKTTTEDYTNATPPAHPFPQHVTYAANSILPNHRTQAQLDQDVQAFYDYWKSTWVTSAGTNGAGDPLYRVKFGTNEPDQTVSEGQGFGMVITALMAGYDPAARDVFDGLWRFTREHPSNIDLRLMDWKVPQAGGDDSAFDGDADIAYGLLLADAQWGSTGDVNYATEANTVIAGILQSTIGPASRLPMLGDWVAPNGSPYNQYTPRSSDFMPAHFRAYGNHTGDPVWDQAVSSAQSVIDSIQANHSPATGLLPDFIINADSTPQPAYSGFLEGPNDGNYYYNAGRDPFRLGVDALLNGDAVSAAQVEKMADWIVSSTGGNALNIKGGYQLDGTPIGNFFTTIFAAPLGVAAMTDAANQSFLNSVYDAVYNRHEGYYEDSVNMLSLLVMTGNFWDSLTFATSDPTFSITAADATKPEGDGGTTAFTFDVTLDQAAAGTVTVDWTVTGSGGDPASAADFGGSLPSGAVTLLAGQTSQTVTVLVTGDTDAENNETFDVTLSNASAGTTIGAGSATGTIQNDDATAVFNYIDVASSDSPVYGSVSGSYTDTHTENNVSQTITEELFQKSRRSRGEHQWTFSVTGGDVGVSFHLIAGHDSTAESFMFEYDAGLGWQPLVTLSSTAMTAYDVALPTTVTGVVSVRAYDTNRSRNENSADTLSVDQVYFLSQRTTPLPPRVSITTIDASAAEAGTEPGVYRIDVDQAQPSDLMVNYTISGNASTGDYAEAFNGTAIIRANQLFTTLTLTPIDDILEEGSESLTLTLSTSANYDLGSPTSATVTIVDDDLAISTFLAESEQSVSSGVIAGNYTDTFTADGVLETVQEIRTGGKPANRSTYLDHRWTFTATNGQSFHLTASRPDNAESEDFIFQYSTDNGSNWTTLITVNSASLTTYEAALPTAASGAILVRVIDSDPDMSGSSHRGSVHIDQMFFSTALAASALAAEGEPPIESAATTSDHDFLFVPLAPTTTQIMPERSRRGHSPQHASPRATQVWVPIPRHDVSLNSTDEFFSSYDRQRFDAESISESIDELLDLPE